MDPCSKPSCSLYISVGLQSCKCSYWSLFPVLSTADSESFDDKAVRMMLPEQFVHLTENERLRQQEYGPSIFVF